MPKSEVLPTKNDIIIVVLGPTGAGKSTFIQCAAERKESGAGHNLGSCTADIQLVKSNRYIDGRRVVFVDTPGFDDTHKSDIEIFCLISGWLEKIHKAKMKIGGILFFYRISDNRMAGSPRRNLELFGSMCGNNAMPYITLVTTMWTHVPKEIGEQREEELKSSFWKEMIEQGSTVRRFEDTADSAWEIVSSSSGRDGGFTKSFTPTGDINVVIMGPTGSGKSTFIKYATEQEDSGAGHNLRSCTADIQLVKSKRLINGRPITFIDTPGFDDTYKSDIEILSLISNWLVEAYGAKVEIHGILYLHRISDNRMAGSPLKNLELFASICGKSAMQNVTLVTIMWKHVPKETGARRERELKEFSWNELIDSGCKVRRFDDSIDSAFDIVRLCLGEDKPLLLTRQVVERHKALKKTEAGITLNKQLQKLLKEQKNSEKKLKEMASKQGNEQERAELEKRNHEIRQKFDNISEQISLLSFWSVWPFSGRRDAKDVPSIGSSY